MATPHPVKRTRTITAAALSLLFLAAPWISHAQDAGRPVVAAVKVERSDMAQEASFDAEFRPYQEIELHAKITGYLETITVDSGDIVKEGQLLATLNVPELETDIDHALATERRGRAETARAQAAYDDAHLVFTRITAADKARPNLIAQQDIDAARSKDLAAAAALDAAKEQEQVAAADVKKLKVMSDYTRITAPFSGVITKRYSDPGALIQAGTSGGTAPLVRLSENDRLRLVFPVSVSFVASIKVGGRVEIHIDSTLNRTISGKIARFSRKVETATRTMDVEVDVPNADLSLTPGMYATAVLQTENHAGAFSVPIEAIARDKSGAASVYVINPDGKVEERQVKPGLETASRIEILSGLKENELVMTSSRAQVKPGDTVEAKVLPNSKSTQQENNGAVKTAVAH